MAWKRKKKHDEDKAFVKRAISGDALAFDTLYKKYFNRVYCSCYRILRDETLALEAADNALFKILKTKSPWDGRSAFSSWLFRVVHNEALMVRRVNQKALLSPEFGVNRIDLYAGDTKCDPIELKYLQKIIREAIDKLPEDERIVIELRDIYAMKTSEISKHLGLKMDAIKSRIFRGRIKLRKHLARAEAHHWLSPKRAVNG